VGRLATTTRRGQREWQISYLNLGTSSLVSVWDPQGLRDWVGQYEGNVGNGLAARVISSMMTTARAPRTSTDVTPATRTLFDG